MKTVDWKIGQIKTKEDLEAIVSPVPIKNRVKILQFLKSAEPYAVGLFPVIDPVIKEVINSGNECYNKEGFEWTNGHTYLFE